MSDQWQWGVGNAKEAKVFSTTIVGEQEVDLIFGEHPHSRCDSNIYARWPDGSIEGFNGHRILHEIEFKDYNYLKESEMSGDEVRKGGTCLIKMNGIGVCEFFYRDVMEALIRARSMIHKIYDLPVQIWNKEELDKLPGRKIYYREFPAVIDYYIQDQGCLILKPDHSDRAGFPPPVYDLEDNDPIDISENETAKVEIYSPHIWWWRK